MDYYRTIENAIDFIEKNLTEKISVEDISKHFFRSKWHFQRIFRTMTGVSVYSYIRRRRLSEAARDLILSGDKIIDIAFHYNYETPETFLREFKKEYGMVPSALRKTDEHFLFEKIDINNEKYKKIYSDKGITWKPVVRKESFFIGKKYRTTMQNDKSYDEIPSIWEKSYKDSIFAKIPGRLNENVTNGIYTGWDIEENFDFLVGALTNVKSVPPKNYVRHTLAKGNYMHFTVYGNEAEKILNGWKYIFGTWFADTGYEHGDADNFDLFDERFYDPVNPCSDIFISIK